MRAMYAGIETGGTKTVCAVGIDGRIEARAQFPTGSVPAALVQQCADFFRPYGIRAAAVATFGPCDVDPGSPTYGRILATPKPGWAGVDLRADLVRALDTEVAVTTDVAAAGLAEARLGAGVGESDLVYVTIGTGIGGGVVREGRIDQGRHHPEMGHVLLPMSGTSGVCPFHGGCFEGLASGPAMAARVGLPARKLGDDDPAWEHEADVVAAGLHTITCALTPDLIVLGGGVGSREALQRRLPDRLAASLAGYLPTPVIRPPGLGADAGVTGALLLAQSQG